MLSFFKRKKKGASDNCPVRNGEILATPARSKAETPTVLLEAPRQRRNAICVMLMPAEYFVARPYFELLNTLSETGLA